MNDEVGHHSTIVHVHPRTESVEYPGDTDRDVFLEYVYASIFIYVESVAY